MPSKPVADHRELAPNPVDSAKFDMARIRSAPIPDEQQLLARWNGNREPLVSILCITYNHRKFIEDSIRGFLIQKTDFPFEIIVHDDASTDGTSELVAKWHERYPNIVKYVRQELNLFGKGASPSAIALEYAKGDFICICEGDDFWVDENKIRIQAESLLSDPSVAVSYHDAIAIDGDGNILQESQLEDARKVDRPAEHLLLAEAWILNLTRMIRRSALHYPPEMFKTTNRDRFLISIIGKFGGAKYETSLRPAVYRVHSGGIWSQLDRQAKQEERINTSFWLYRYHQRTGNAKLAREFELTFLKYVMQRFSLSRVLLGWLLRLRLLARLRRHFKRGQFH